MKLLLRQTCLDALFKETTPKEESSSAPSLHNESIEHPTAKLQAVTAVVKSPVESAGRAVATDLEKIMDFIAKRCNAAVASGDSKGMISMAFLKAYFNSNLESSWFKFSLDDNIRAAKKQYYICTR